MWFRSEVEDPDNLNRIRTLNFNGISLLTDTMDRRMNPAAAASSAPLSE